MNHLFSNDGVHPSEQGHKNILNMVIGAFDGLYFKQLTALNMVRLLQRPQVSPVKAVQKLGIPFLMEPQK